MANSLVTIVSQIFGAQLIARVATSLGINPTLAQTLANAAVPAVLAALGNLAASPAGAQKIAAQIQSQDSNILGNLVNAVGSPNQTSFLNSGAGMLSSLLGGGATSGISDALAKFTGAQPAQAQSILGLVTPATFGALAQQDPEIWSSGEGISALFKREQSAIAGAIPSGLAGSLASTGLFSNIAGLGDKASQAAAGLVQGAAGAASGAAARAAQATSSVAAGAANASSAAVDRAEAAASGIPGWLKIVIPVVLIALLGWFLMPRTPAPVPAPAQRSTAPTAVTPPAAATSAAATAQQAAVELAAFAQKTNGAFGNAMTTLTGITNVDQAKAAQPKLTELANDLGGLAQNFGKLPGEARTAMAGPMQGMLGTLRDQLARVMAIPGVGEILKPVADQLGTAVNAFKG